ncbi:MAG: hypothetical protein WCC00_10350 [Candidatus Aminicenantales bacterium]
MDGKCPFCWSRNVTAVGQPGAGQGGPFAARRLMECAECEKWYWADSGEEVVRLFEICSTSMIDPKSCLEDVREVLNSGGSGFPRRRTAEFNRLCSDCLNARFVQRRTAAHA